MMIQKIKLHNRLMGRVIVLIATLLLSFSSKSQKKEEIEKWLYSIESEFPEIDRTQTKSKLISGSREYNMIRFNLLSDKYFKPIFLESFDQLKKSKRNKIAVKINKYKNKQFPWAKRLDWYLWGVYGEGRVYQKAIDEVKSLRAKRNEYESTVAKVIASNMSFYEITEVKNSITKKFITLLPSEIQTLESLINEEQLKAANRTILSKVDEINSFQNTFDALNELERFKEKNLQIYRLCSNENKSIFDGKIRDKKENIIENIVSTETNKLQQTDFEKLDIENINELWNNLQKTFEEYESYQATNKLFALYKSKKSSYVAKNLYSIAKMTENIFTVGNVSYHRDIYLLNTERTEEVKLLDSFFDDRIEAIYNFLDKQREKYNSKSNERRRLIIEKRKEIKEKRIELEEKYASKLPTLVDIFEIMRLGDKIKDQAFISDEKEFINRLKKLGYEMAANELFSDVNSFRNAKGWEIYTYRKDDENNNQVIVTSNFVINDAPQEIIDLYVTEITTEYRNSDSLFIKPWSEGELFDDSGFYVKSGSTFYICKSENDTLRVSSYDNLDAEGVIVSEQIGFNTLKVTPWTNYTSVKIYKGDIVTLKASGSITLGDWLGDCSPSGVSGNQNYNIEPAFNHGSLIARIGSGEWFYVGTHKTFRAEESGLLQLKINDNDLWNNDGYFEVRYRFDY